MSKHFSVFLAVMITAICFALPVQAQDEDGGTAADLVLITPNPGEGAALEAAIREYHLWVADKPGAFRYNWYAIETGPNTGKYAARSGNHNWSDFDQEYDWEEEAGAKFEELVAPHIHSLERTLTEEMEEFAYWPEDWTGYTHFQLENWYVKGGHYGAFREGLTTIHAALSEAGYSGHFGFHSVVSGGKGNQVTLVLPMKGHAGFGEKDPSFTSIVSEALGGMEAFGEFMGNWSSTYKVGESWLVRRLPEASDYGDSE